ncbi:hypothetical protein HY045_03720, partial [Candidatus Woesebacteria bacterium]|nr:hypothetical protein [Candidatus Woesebacteria bacterium]
MEHKTEESNKHLEFIFTSFFLWRIGLFIVAVIAVNLIHSQANFLGGGLENYTKAPWFWGWSNFDGEHYLSIARFGYRPLEQAFFPLYPLLIRLTVKIFDVHFIHPELANISGLLISNASFLIGLMGFYNVLQLDYSEKITKLAVFLILIFPTSFYFGSVYTEGLFFALIIWSFYFARKRNWFIASLLALLSSMTRIVGIIMLPALIVEFLLAQQSMKFNRKAIWLLLIPLGLISYMIFLKIKFGDPLAFIHTLPSFGEQRSGTPILLPQVFYRYLFKIFPNLNYSYLPLIFTTFLEFFSSLLFLIISIFSLLRLRLSYSIYLVAGFLLPTLSGSFS